MREAALGVSCSLTPVLSLLPRPIACVQFAQKFACVIVLENSLRSPSPTYAPMKASTYASSGPKL